MAVKRVAQSYKGKGKVYVGLDSAHLREVGNCTEVTLEQSVNEDKVPNMQSCSGGDWDIITDIESVSAKIIISDYSKENMALAVAGTVGAYASQTLGSPTPVVVTAANKGQLIAIPGILPTAVTVTDTAGTPYVVGEDYEIRSGGVFLLEDGNHADGNDIDYVCTTGSADLIEALTKLGEEMYFFFEGMNAAKGCEKINIHAFRVKFGPAAAIELLTSEHGKLDVSAGVLADTSQPPGSSQYYRIYKQLQN